MEEQTRRRGNGVIEANVNLAVATALANNLRNMGYDVREYRTTNDENVITPIAADLRNVHKQLMIGALIILSAFTPIARWIRQ